MKPPTLVDYIKSYNTMIYIILLIRLCAMILFIIVHITISSTWWTHVDYLSYIKNKEKRYIKQLYNLGFQETCFFLTHDK